MFPRALKPHFLESELQNYLIKDSTIHNAHLRFDHTKAIILSMAERWITKEKGGPSREQNQDLNTQFLLLLDVGVCDEYGFIILTQLDFSKLKPNDCYVSPHYFLMHMVVSI